MASFSKRNVRGTSRYPLRLEELERREVPTLFVVTTTVDGGPGSLRQAVLDSNSLPGNDEIYLPAGTYRLTIAGAGEDQGATGDLDLRDNVWLYGEGAGTSVIDGNRLDRVFHVHQGVTAGFYAVTVSGGQALQGAGLYQEPTSSLRLWETVVSGNEAVSSNYQLVAQGGGLYATTASTEFWRATFNANMATGSSWSGVGLPGGSAQGGGAYLFGGNLVSLESVFTNNTVSGGPGAGGTFVGRGGDAAGGALHVTNSSVLAHQGRVAGNSATAGTGGQGQCFFPPMCGASGGLGGSGWGGGLAQSGGRVELSEVPFSNNRVQGGGGGGSVGGGARGSGGPATGGAVYLGSGSFAIYRGTLEDNQATGGNGGLGGLFGCGCGGDGGFAGGGGLGVSDVGTLVLLETEVLNNVALGGAATSQRGLGGNAHGGGIWVGSGDAVLADTTIRGNRVTGGFGIGSQAGRGIGGGLYVANIWAYGRNVIIADNQASTSDPDLFGMLYPF